MLEIQRQLRDRTQAFSLRIMRLVRALPQTRETDVFGKQLLRSGTSVAANYRAANCCRTKAEFINKLRLVLEEADETVYWLRCIRDAELVRPTRLDALLDEAGQLVAIFTASLRTARSQRKSGDNNPH